MNDYFDVKDGTDGANNDYFFTVFRWQPCCELGTDHWGTRRLVALIAVRRSSV